LSKNKLNFASRSFAMRSSREIMCSGSTDLMRNGSMMVFTVDPCGRTSSIEAARR
jgi:hypothetical protein